MLFQLIRETVETLIGSEVETKTTSRAAILRKSKKAADEQSEQYWSVSPVLNYESVYAQIGYIYRQGAANAYMFKSAYSNPAVSKKLKSTSRRTLRAVAVGGGPGTELVGLAAILCGHYRKDWPRRIRFLVIDRVPAWANCLTVIRRIVARHLKAVANTHSQKPPKISESFLALDVFDEASWSSFNAAFDGADIVVLNYVLSENKVKLEGLARMVKKLRKAIPSGCLVLVIDRAEGDGLLTEAIQSSFDGEFGANLGAMFGYGTIGESADEMGAELKEALGTPRLVLSREGRPNTFWMVWMKSPHDDE